MVCVCFWYFYNSLQIKWNVMALFSTGLWRNDGNSFNHPSHYHNEGYVLSRSQQIRNWHILQGTLQSSNTNPIPNPHIAYVGFHLLFRRPCSCASTHVTCLEHRPKSTNCTLDTTVSGQNVNKPLHHEMFWAEAKPPAPVPRERCFCLASKTWLAGPGHWHHPAGFASRPWQRRNLSHLLPKCETLFSSFTTTVCPPPLCWGAEAHTHLGLYYYTREDSTFCNCLPYKYNCGNLIPIKPIKSFISDSNPKRAIVICFKNFKVPLTLRMPQGPF